MRWSDFRLKSRKFIFTLTCVFALATPTAFAQNSGFYKTVEEKQEQKRQSRWTLADWLAQKRDMRLMDLWLAKNSYSSPFEFYLEGTSINYNLENKTDGTHENYNRQTGEFAAFAGRAGIRASGSIDDEKRSSWEGALAFRVYGQAIQDTHIGLEWGFKGMNVKSPSSERFQNQFGAVQLDLYLTKYFGVGGRYARILPARSNLNRSLEGEDASARVFIDFSAVQVFGEWRHEQLRTKSKSATTETRPGFGGGLRIFF